MFAEEPIAVADVASVVATCIPAAEPPTIPSEEIFSPFANTVVTLSEPVLTYLTNRVIGSAQYLPLLQ